MLRDLSKNNRFFLFFHLTVGTMVLYPFSFRLVISLLHLTDFLSSEFINISYNLILIVSTLFIAKDLLSMSWIRFKPHFIQNIVLVFKLFPLLIIISVLFNSLAVFLTGQDSASNQSLLNELFQTSPFYITLSALIYAPLMEELLFRGFFYGFFEKRSQLFALIISGLTFGLAHMWTGQFNIADFAFLPSYSLLGMIIAYSYQKTHSIYTPILLHFLNNLMGVLIMVYS